MASESVDRKWLMVMSNQLWFASNWLVSKPLCIKMTCLYLDSHTTQPRVQTWCILSIRCKTNHQWEKNTRASFFRERWFSSVRDNEESNLRPLDSQLLNVPPLSHRDSMASKAHYKGSPLWTFVGYHTQMFCLNEGSQKLSFNINWLLESGRSGLCMGQ